MHYITNSLDLWHTFDNSAETGIIPEDWKSANVTTNLKKLSRQESGNYRPISHTSVVRKTMERLDKDTLITHLEKKDLIAGSRNKRSCQTSLLDFFAQVKDTYDTDNNKVVDLVLLDFQKALHKVPHERLMLKVNVHGIQ